MMLVVGLYRQYKCKQTYTLCVSYLCLIMQCNCWWCCRN